ncbi:Signal transducer regulating beta-lactamase production, contains metallopeptidase domain [Reichenbachiella faecimaris]|uniref:Signal transducer regulating beta-lactamase production, contains metallopeptidase domain n=1 Tax=Reichenbachiella faecimaris TaxID=692418 RepID=A0A1W2GDE1_REIFA|nr:M56 family metallopeptidase [Reichenbachiella faecimaris]SMD34611.1 Signal transducer regulating beta-lactamase production, contains metallopeptidase domain [Reichenbachiella faecimaris]
MDKFIWYLMESSVMLTCLYALYVLILRKETFFSLNRFYLIGIVLFSLVFPLLSFDFNPAPVAQLPIQEISKARVTYYDAFAEWTYVHTSAAPVATSPTRFSEINWGEVALWTLIGLYLIGVVVCLSRTAWTVQWIYGLIRRHAVETHEGVQVVKMKNQMAPFSFLNFVFVHEEIMGTAEFDYILAHERTHVQQRHAADLIFVQLLAAFFWFNPVIWRLIKSLKTTHEYIADNHIINKGYSLVEYQTLLLRQLISNNSYGLVHNFNLSFIKKRITMMKNKKSGGFGKVKVAAALVFTLVFGIVMIQCNSAMDEQTPITTSEKAISNNFSDGVNLPVITGREGVYYASESDLLNFTVVNDKLTIDGVEHEVDEIAKVITASGLTSNGIIALRVDRDQKMEMIRAIQTELRKANRRKVLQLGQSSLGQVVESPMLLPPMPGQSFPGSPEMPKIDDAYAKEHDIDILKIFLGKHADLTHQKNVYDFVKDQMAKGKSNYVVSTKFSNSDSYGTYLKNWVYIQEGFNKIYQERSQAMFGKNYLELNKDIPEEKTQYDAVRKGIPRAISLAEQEGDC